VLGSSFDESVTAMNWVALTAIGTLLSAAIIAITALVAIVQIRHLRSATALQGFLEVMREAAGGRVGHANTYIEEVLPQRLKDPVYRQELIDGKFDPETHPELLVGSLWERVGALIHHRYIDAELFLDYSSEVCSHQWDLLKEAAALRRQRNPLVWERFEELALRCRAYIDARKR
jgi:hypothetical protein